MGTLRLIVGSGRSGTTWIQDAVAVANDLRPVFEPLNPYASDLGRRYAHCALSPDDEHHELKRFLDDVFAGRRLRLWTKYRRQWRWFLPRQHELRLGHRGANVLNRWARFVREAPGLARLSANETPLAKCIWSNLLLGWLVRQYDCRLLLVVRHPGAVIESELRNNWNADFAINRFRKDASFDDLTEGRYRRLLGRELSPVEGLAVRWLVENQWVMERQSRLRVTIVHYEHLSSGPDAAWKRICDALELQQVPDAGTISKPSQQSDLRGPAADWRTSLSAEQKERIQAILDEGDFALYSMDDDRPHQRIGSASGMLHREVAR